MNNFTHKPLNDAKIGDPNVYGYRPASAWKYQRSAQEMGVLNGGIAPHSLGAL